MAECEQDVQNVEDETDEPKVNYKPPAEKTIEQILKTDEEDESLKKYKEKLLGQAGANPSENEFWPGKPNVILKTMIVEMEGCPERNVQLDLEDPSQLKDVKFPIKEGTQYQIKLVFNVQREIVSGLRFINKVSRGPFNSKEQHMVGSFAPKKEVYEFKLPKEELPKGLTGRGEYKVKSLFTDDDKNEILGWNWLIQVKQNWKD